jgi:hypothetical protein
VAAVAEPLTPEYEAAIREHVDGMSNYSLGNLFARDLLAEVDRLRAELAATVKAKQENDERFQIAAAEQRDRAEKAEAQVTELEKQVAGLDDLRLRAIDKGDSLRAQLAQIERDNPATSVTHRCGIPLVRRLDCGHCPHEVCQDCDRCPHFCGCSAQTGGA